MKRSLLLFLSLFAIVGLGANVVCAMDNKRSLKRRCSSDPASEERVLKRQRRTSDGLEVMPGFGLPEDSGDEDSIQRMDIANQHAAAEQRRLMRVETDGKKRPLVDQQKFNPAAKNFAFSVIKNLRDSDKFGSTSVTAPVDFDLPSNVENIQNVLLKAAGLYVKNDSHLAADAEVFGYNFPDLADEIAIVRQGEASRFIFD